MHDGSIPDLAAALDYELYYRGLAREQPAATFSCLNADSLDARMLAEMAQVFPARLRPHTRLEPWQCELRGWLRRRHQVTEAIQRTCQQLARLE